MTLHALRFVSCRSGTNFARPPCLRIYEADYNNFSFVTTFKVTGIWIEQSNRLIRIILYYIKTYIVFITRFDKFSSQAYNWTFVWKKFDRYRFRSDKNWIKLVKFQAFATCAESSCIFTHVKTWITVISIYHTSE